MKRSPLKRTQWRHRPKRDVVWEKARLEALERDQHRCQASYWGLTESVQCWGEPHVHHRLPRKHGGGHDLENLVTLCAKCHQHVHEHPTIAYALGLLVRSSHPSAKSVTVSGAPTGHQPVLADGRFVSELVYPPVTQDAESPE